LWYKKVAVIFLVFLNSSSTWHYCWKIFSAM
jgi:hypothetical protein